MIRLRLMEAADKEMVRNWRNLPEVSRHMYTDHYITPEEHEAWLDSTLRDPSKLHWIICHEDADVGVAYLYDIDQTNRRCSWGLYVADPKMRGRGIGGLVENAVLRHVFEDLGLHKICCEVLASNRPALALYEKFGFSREGCFREHIFKDGQFVDVVCLAMTRPDWEAKRPEIKRRVKRIEQRYAQTPQHRAT
jgi:UDP-4-amino-4,6-dideoxy-N-acetyl-beta-L-altrosamine N-acetyltransferase